MRGIHFIWSFLAIVALSMSLTTEVTRAQEYVTFAFAPPDHLQFEETHIVVKEIATGLDQPEAQTDVTKTDYELRKTSTGYVVVATPRQEEALSETGANMVNALMSRATITYELDNQGQLVRVKGADRAYNALREVVPPELIDTFLSVLGASDQTAAQMIGNAWNGRRMLGQFTGRRLMLDSVYAAAGSFPLPVGGTVEGTVEIGLTRTECGAADCVNVFTSFRSTDQAVADRMGAAMRDLIVGVGRAFLVIIASNPELRRAFEEETGTTLDPSADLDSMVPLFEMRNPVFTGENLRVIDPTTGLLYSEGDFQTITVDLAIEDEVLTGLELRYKHSYEYTFRP